MQTNLETFKSSTVKYFVQLRQSLNKSRMFVLTELNSGSKRRKAVRINSTIVEELKNAANKEKLEIAKQYMKTRKNIFDVKLK